MSSYHLLYEDYSAMQLYSHILTMHAQLGTQVSTRN